LFSLVGFVSGGEEHENFVVWGYGVGGERGAGGVFEGTGG
jgi:hypothetical protein